MASQGEKLASRLHCTPHESLTETMDPPSVLHCAPRDSMARGGAADRLGFARVQGSELGCELGCWFSWLLSQAGHKQAGRTAQERQSWGWQENGDSDSDSAASQPTLLGGKRRSAAGSTTWMQKAEGHANSRARTWPGGEGEGEGDESTGNSGRGEEGRGSCGVSACRGVAALMVAGPVPIREENAFSPAVSDHHGGLSPRAGCSSLQ